MRRASCAALLAVCSVAAAARAQVFSPGPLNKGHANLEGLANCTKCHVAGGQLSDQRCLDCHTELKQRVVKRPSAEINMKLLFLNKGAIHGYHVAHMEPDQIAPA